MVYAKVDANITLVKILSEEDYKSRDKDSIFMNVSSSSKIKDGSNIENINFGIYYFHDVMEAKINIALARILFYEKELVKHSENYKFLFGDSYKSVNKTRMWLEKKEIKYPEYFI